MEAAAEFLPDLVDEINKWDTLHPTDNFDLGNLDDIMNDHIDILYISM